MLRCAENFQKIRQCSDIKSLREYIFNDSDHPFYL